jgi:biotin synthase
LAVDEVVEQAREAKANGASRFCMGAAWRQVRDNKDFDRTLEMVTAVGNLGLEVCATFGMLTAAQAQRLEAAGLTAYNHNVDTSAEYYGEIIGTRVIEQRLATLAHVRSAGLRVCSGGIIGMGESLRDRAAMLVLLANLPQHPESVPINSLVPIAGTPLADQELVAVARVMMPSSRIRLAAGRRNLSREGQALAFLCGANSIFYGDRLLTTDNPDVLADQALFADLGITPLAARPRATNLAPKDRDEAIEVGL